MSGILRQHAAAAVEAGWDPAVLLQIQYRCVNDGLDADPLSSWGFRVGRYFIVYRGTPVGEVDRLFDSLRIQGHMWPLVTAYTDGSGNRANTTAGIGVVVYDPRLPRPLMIAQNIGLGTNNRAELCAVWAALRAYPELQQPLLIRSDSEYAIGVLSNLDWALNANVELIKAIRLDLAQREPGAVKFEHVDGHSGHEGNEVADKLANIGRKVVAAVTEYEG